MDHWHMTIRGKAAPRVRASGVKTWPDRVDGLFGVVPCASPVIAPEGLCEASAARLGYLVADGQIVRPGKAGLR